MMMVKSVKPGEVGGCTAARLPPFTLSTITSKVVVYAPAERGRYTPPISPLPLYALCGCPTQQRQPPELILPYQGNM